MGASGEESGFWLFGGRYLGYLPKFCRFLEQVLPCDNGCVVRLNFVWVPWFGRQRLEVERGQSVGILNRIEKGNSGHPSTHSYVPVDHLSFRQVGLGLLYRDRVFLPIHLPHSSHPPRRPLQYIRRTPLPLNW